jgi:hypothetical protein
MSNVFVQNGQSLIDLVIQEYGSVEGFINLLKLNGLSAMNNPANGTTIKVDTLAIIDQNIRSFFSGRFINTGYEGTSKPMLLNDDGSPILADDANPILT